MEPTNLAATLPQEDSQKNVMLSGIITGQLAGLIMAVVVMIVFMVFLGKSPLYPVQVIGTAVFGAEALNGFHFGAVLAGLILHQAGPSVLWGVLFGFLAKRFAVESSKEAMLLGGAVGLISMAGPFVLIPFLLKTLHGVDFWNQEVPILWDWAAHIVFGLSFGLYPLVRKKLAAKLN